MNGRKLGFPVVLSTVVVVLLEIVLLVPVCGYGQRVPKGPKEEPAGTPASLAGEGFEPAYFVSAAIGRSAGLSASRKMADRCSNAKDAYFLELHGAGKDPTEGSREEVAVIKQTWEAFLSAAAGKRTDAESVTYPANSYPDVTNVRSMVDAENRGVQNLDRAILAAVHRCRGQRIVLAGYSMGAWIIDDWLTRRSHRSLWSSIRGVVLYGDPQWKRDANLGIARQAPIYSPVDPYPPDGPIVDRWESLCLPQDPICGEGYANGGGRQLADVFRCTVTCEHMNYSEYGGGKRGGQFLASTAFKG